MKRKMRVPALHRAAGRMLVLGMPLAAAIASPAASGPFTYTGSAQAATGTYLSSRRTNGVYLFSGLTFSTGSWSFSAGAPLVAQSNPGLVYAGGAAIASDDDPGHDGHHRKQAESAAVPQETHSGEVGLGDPLVRADVLVLKARRHRPSMRLVAQVKAPLATRGDHAFGTGEWDYGAGLSVAKPLGRGFVFADATYWVLGDLPDVALENAVAYGVSYGRPIGAQKLTLLGSFIGYSRLVAGVDPPAQAGVMLGYWMRPQRSLSAGLSFGVTDSAPDVSFSLGWRVGL